LSNDLSVVTHAPRADAHRRPTRTLYVDDDSTTASVLLARLDPDLLVVDRYRLDPGADETLRSLCSEAEAVVVVSTGWDSASVKATAETVEMLINNLDGTGKRLLYLSDATVVGDTGNSFGNEDNSRSDTEPHPWHVTAEEHLARALSTGVHSIVVRPTLVHGRGTGALLQRLYDYADREGESLFVADGDARTSTIHIDDLAALVQSALLRAPAGSVYAAASTEVLSWREIAIAVGQSTTPPAAVRSVWAAEADRLGFDSAIMTTNCVIRDDSAHRRLGWAAQAPRLAALADVT
jgi:nucleoside-diphosphate-sugar epimerase